MRAYVAVISAAVLVFVDNSLTDTIDGLQTVILNNGCNITRAPANGTAPKIPWYGMPLPHLKCTGTGITQLQLEGDISYTKSFTVSYTNMIEFYVDDLTDLTNVTKIEFKSNKITRLVPSPNNLILSNVYYIWLANNRLTAIPNQALKAFPNLEVLVLHSNQIGVVYHDDFRFNLKISHLTLGPNPIKYFEDEWMKKMNISSMQIRGCGLTKLPLNVAEMTELNFVDFSDNNITELRANSFLKCKSLFWLDIASNKLKNVHEDAFKGLERLISLDLSDNLLETLPPNSFRELGKENLQIDMYENPFNCNCAMAGFKNWFDETRANDLSTEVHLKCNQPKRNHNKKLNKLSVDDFTCRSDDMLWTDDCTAPSTTFASGAVTSSSDLVTITTLPVSRSCPSSCTCFDENQKIYHPKTQSAQNKENVIRLRRIRKSYPRVECVDTTLLSFPTTVPNDAKLVILIKNKKFTTLDMKKLRDLQSVETLYLKSNAISTWTADSGTVLPKLAVLVLSSNKITSVTNAHMRSFPNLTHISLYHNLIKVIPGDLFALNSKLSGLYLGPNPVTTFQEDFLISLRLRTLSLRNLSLKAVPKLMKNMENLVYVDMSDNSITTLYNFTFSKCSSLGKVNLENNLISKIEADAFKGATELTTIDLSENRLETLPGTVFANNAKERLNVDLWQNSFTCNCSLKDFKAWIEKAEDEDPSTEVRFNCEYPSRMHDKKSNEISSKEFVCSKGDSNDVHHDAVSVSCNQSTQIALSVILTSLCTAVMCALFWRYVFKRRYEDLIRYAKQRNDFSTDMEELH